MKNLKLMVILFLIVVLTGSVSIVSKKTEKPLIQMAILLDTSGSMQGLIEQAKAQLWKIVNELAVAKRNGKGPRMEVALYEYGKSSIPASEGYLRMIVPLSMDLDQISEELFKLRTNGGSEYCGKVINASLEGLKWSAGSNDYKVIFIAGNEPFTQGDVDYKIACKAAISKGIVVNTIYCGNYRQGVQTMWKDGADLADGRYMNINHNRRVIHITAPQDKKIIELGKELNRTYVAFGKTGNKGKERQREQDKNAQVMNPGVMVERSVTKASKQYKNTGWDLVDAEKEGTIKIEEVKEEELPKEMQGMSVKEKKEYINKMKKKRENVQKKIQQLKKDRDKYVADKRKKMAGDNTLDLVIVKTVKEQAGKKNYKFEKK